MARTLAMFHPDSIKQELEAMPALLRALLDAELAAGNEITEIGHSFPAPPSGTFFKLARPLITRERKSGGGIEYRARNSSICSGEITDGGRRYFLIEPPHIEAESIQYVGGTLAATTVPPSPLAEEVPTARVRFENSTSINYEKWHDGVGYDVTALQEMSGEEKRAAEEDLLARGVRDWRDIEALACLGTPGAMRAIRGATDHPNPEIRMAIARHAPELISDANRTDNLVRLLESATFFAGLGQAIDQAAEYHPQPVIEALFRGALSRPGDVAVHFAAMLCFIHGRASAPFDMAQRDFFLRFNTEIRDERESVFRVLCQKIGVDGTSYLKSEKITPANLAVISDADYTVEIDIRGETLTYCELNRSAYVVCTFYQVPCVSSGTLSNWYYPLGRRSEKMSAQEKQIILDRIVSYCRNHHGMTKLTVE